MTADELRARLAEARDGGAPGRFVEAIPFARFLGLSVEARGDELVTTMRYDPKLVGNPSVPALHGGTMGGLLESAAIFALLLAPETTGMPRIINITVDYLRSARPIDTHAAAVITKQGRRVTTVQAHAWQEDRQKPVASAHLHFLVQEG